MLQYLDFSHASTSRKWGHKRQGDGMAINPALSVQYPSDELDLKSCILAGCVVGWNYLIKRFFFLSLLV